ncbi:MAG: hypothetical protein K2O88_06905 [Paramuribaculum sp.]|nr:hypothetical protein [Paramuribaculum sp.]
MADNYLERKMEEHRKGALCRTVRKVATAGCKPGVWQLPFVERRVLIVGTGQSVDAMLVESLRNVGCKVAFMGGESDAGVALARKTGAQFHPVDYECEEDLRRSVALICRAWGDIDVVVGTAVECPFAIVEAWAEFRSNKPYPNPFGGRLVAVASAEWSDDAKSLLLPYGVTTAVVKSDDDATIVDVVMMALIHKFTVL